MSARPWNVSGCATVANPMPEHLTHASTPLTADAFAVAMSRVGPFEVAPLICVGVSGGADSMALVLLCDHWARARGGRVIALSVDHGLRTGSADEARQVSEWLAAYGIEHHILHWHGTKPTSAIQSKARDARRQLMLDWCVDHGVLHLAFAHHVEDQAETYVMRLGRGSGPDGLAAMSSISEYAQARIIRPLLGHSHDELIATLQGMGQGWVEDPSNTQDRFERVRVRKALAALDDAGANMTRIACTVSSHGSERRELEALSARVLARSMNLHPAGFARLDVRSLSHDGDVLGRRALGRIVMTLGGRQYGAAREKLERLYDQIKTTQLGRGVTLGGCRITPGDDGLLICRENRNLPQQTIAHMAANLRWDQRFDLAFTSDDVAQTGSLTLTALGATGWRDIAAQAPQLKAHSIPLYARYSLPALYHDGEIVQVPHLTYRAPDRHPCRAWIAGAAFMPPQPVFGGVFAIA